MEKKIIILIVTFFRIWNERSNITIKTFSKTTKKHDDKQYGGFLPLAPIGATILSAFGGKLVGKLYDLVKRKIKGTGYEHKMKHNTLYEKRKFLNHVLNKY